MILSNCSSSEWSNLSSNVVESFIDCFIDDVTDRLNLTSRDLADLLTCNDTEAVKQMKIKQNFLYDGNPGTPGKFKKVLLSLPAGERTQMLFAQLTMYRAHKAWLSSHRFSALDGHADRAHCIKRYSVMNNNTDTNDWQKFTDLIVEKLLN